MHTGARVCVRQGPAALSSPFQLSPLDILQDLALGIYVGSLERSYSRDVQCIQELEFAFGRALQRIPLRLVWGVHPQDTGSLNSVYEYTDAALDTTTDLTARASQEWLAALCDELVEMSGVASGPVVAGSVQCPIDMLRRIGDATGEPMPVGPEVCSCFAERHAAPHWRRHGRAHACWP